jgi:predicted HicB family RNase H-like nuclease
VRKAPILNEAIARAIEPRHRKQLSIRLRPEHYDAIEVEAKKAGVSMNEIVSRIVEVALEQQEVRRV